MSAVSAAIAANTAAIAANTAAIAAHSHHATVVDIQTDQVIVWMVGAVILLMALVGLALLRRQGQ